MKTKIMTILLIIVWMAVVFKLSNQVSSESSALSRTMTEKILIYMHITDNMSDKEANQLIQKIEIIIRKLAHYTLYMLGGLLILLHVNLYQIKMNKKIIISWFIGTAYAVLDEVHQLFVFGRSGEFRDVCIDSLGVMTGIMILLLILKCIKCFSYYKTMGDNK